MKISDIANLNMTQLGTSTKWLLFDSWWVKLRHRFYTLMQSVLWLGEAFHESGLAIPATGSYHWIHHAMYSMINLSVIAITYKKKSEAGSFPEYIRTQLIRYNMAHQKNIGFIPINVDEFTGWLLDNPPQE